MAKPTSGQMKEFWTLVDSGHVNTENLQAFLRNPNRGDGGIIEIELELEYRDGIVVELRNAGGPWGYCSEQINDNNYPVDGEGVVKLKFRLIPGEEFKSENDGCYYPADFQAYCKEHGLREPNAAEALLPVARDKQLGRGDHPMVAFVGGSRVAFVVYEHRHARCLSQHTDSDSWRPSCLFLAVCE